MTGQNYQHAPARRHPGGCVAPLWSMVPALLALAWVTSLAIGKG